MNDTDAVEAIRDLLDEMRTDVVDASFTDSVSELHQRLLPESLSETVNQRIQAGLGPEDVDDYPRRGSWLHPRWRVEPLSTDVDVPIAVLIPVFLGFIAATGISYAGVLSSINLLVLIVVCTVIAVVLEIGAMVWWHTADPLRLSAADKRVLAESEQWLTDLITAGGDLIELRLWLVAGALSDAIAAVPEWSTGNFDTHRMRLDLPGQLREIFDTSVDLARTRAELTSEGLGGISPHDAQWLDQVEESVIDRLAALWTYQRQLLELQHDVDTDIRRATRLAENDDALGPLLTRSAQSDLAAASIGDLVDEVEALRSGHAEIRMRTEPFLAPVADHDQGKECERDGQS